MASCGRHPSDSQELAARPSGVHAARRWWIDLTLGGRSTRVEVPRLISVRVLGRDVARLDDLWAASRFGVRPSELAFDFIAEDGYRVSAHVEGGIDGAELATGYVCIATRDLVWQPAPERPCFWHVKAVARVIATPRAAVAGANGRASQ